MFLEEPQKRRLCSWYNHDISSYGLFNYPDLVCDYVRAGIARYGVLSSPGDGSETSNCDKNTLTYHIPMKYNNT